MKNIGKMITKAFLLLITAQTFLSNMVMRQETILKNDFLNFDNF
jgi:hypothetical protein